jgi:butyryl-CoA dehydrogenase
MANPLVSDAFVDYLLFDVLDAEALTRLPAFEGHGRDTFRPWLEACRRVAREVLYPLYRPFDLEPPTLQDGRLQVHPRMHGAYRELRELGLIAAARPVAVGGQQLPLLVAAMGQVHLMAANLSAYGFAGLTTGAGHLIEAFGSEALKATCLEKLYSGAWTGTMALTEPQAGSSLADLTTRARPVGDGYRLVGSKIFISGGDHDLTENIVHLVLARLDGAPPGSKGISLFAVPRLRPEAGGLVDNDVRVSGLIHKIGWRGLPSLAVSFGESDDCHGFLVGPPHQGLRCMFQMMNEARLMVGLMATATASVAFHESLAYARERRQGRLPGSSDASTPQVPLVAHPDVRRMLLRQKAIVEGSLALLGTVARLQDLAEHAVTPAERARARLLGDFLIPIAKTFPAEKGFEANALALQLHGGYGYSSEYLPEAWLRDQKLNTIHEGTTTIQGLDLVGRKALAGQGAALAALAEEVASDAGLAARAGLEVGPLTDAVAAAGSVSAALLRRAGAGDVEGLLGHSADYLELMSVVVVGWMWARLVGRLGPVRDDDLAQGLRAAARYWFAAELPRVRPLAVLVESGERSYLDCRDAWL